MKSIANLFIIMTEIFKLVPFDPTTDSKLMLLKDRQDREPISLTILGWQRVLPNKAVVPVANPDTGMYQCTALDNHCCIEVTISYKVNQKNINKSIKSNPVSLTRQLKQRALYVIEPMHCRVTIDQFSVYMRVLVQNKKLKFLTESGKFQATITDHTIQVEPFNFVVKVNFSTFSHEFLRFYCDSLKWIPKFRSNYCFCIFNSKIEQDLFLVSVSDAFKEPSLSNTQIKIIGALSTTPRNEKQLKNDGSASSLASNNKSQQKNKQKVKISERLNLKKSCTKLNSNKIVSSKRQCLNIFEQDSQNNQSQEAFHRRVQQQSTFKQSDASMDLRGSFEQLQKNTTHVEEDKLSSHSFKQKQIKAKDSLTEQQNSKLRSENCRLKKQIESMSQVVKEASALKRKYLNVVQQLNRLESERIAIVKDKMKFQSAYYEEMQEKQKLKREIEALKISLIGQKNLKS